MTAANFPAELSDELAFEGGYSDDPRDPGGPTDFGITLATLSHWAGRPATAAQLRALSAADRSAIYRACFWNLVQGDALPGGVDLVVFDMAVNGGPRRAAELLQGVLGVAMDGVVGPVTLAHARAVPGLAIVGTYGVARRAFYRSLGGFNTYGAGWLARVDACQAEAVELLA